MNSGEMEGAESRSSHSKYSVIPQHHLVAAFLKHTFLNTDDFCHVIV